LRPFGAANMDKLDTLTETIRPYRFEYCDDSVTMRQSACIVARAGDVGQGAVAPSRPVTQESSTPAKAGAQLGEGL